MPVDASELSDKYPLLYHMAADGSWPLIQQYGLRSTSALLDLFKVRQPLRAKIEEQHRPQSVEIEHPRIGKAVIRDQKPMSDRGLLLALKDGLTPSDWYRILNSKVFFWLTEDRLKRLRNAGAYRQLPQVVLTLSTASVLKEHCRDVFLAPMNTGCTAPYPHPRGRGTFSSLDDYPYAERARYGNNQVVEFAVQGAIASVEKHVISVFRVSPDGERKLLYKAKGSR